MPSAWGLARWVLRGKAAWSLQASGCTRSYSTQLPDNLLPVVGTAADMRRTPPFAAQPPASLPLFSRVHPPTHTPPFLARRWPSWGAPMSASLRCSTASCDGGRRLFTTPPAATSLETTKRGSPAWQTSGVVGGRRQGQGVARVPGCLRFLLLSSCSIPITNEQPDPPASLHWHACLPICLCLCLSADSR
jgi:hypothetical protein